MPPDDGVIWPRSIVPRKQEQKKPPDDGVGGLRKR
jgi:hypothetical protein